ncbi:signal peptidase II [Suttonella sp. R2A3]|uniref:signal peptidase II n=1 Tax=Suttonella sp. R2A3 TaxID=2908648 RepID=UPI001F41C990|nr:signal peptidase II [Suttonella sp. R2A3]UJF24941.1 signal peptidase II [Suttonella sp. R2A3]
MRIAALVLALLWVAFDYVTKQWALSTLADQSIVVNEYMNFALAFNRGAAFSFLADHGGWQRWLFLGLAVVVSIWLIYAILTEKPQWLMLLGYGSILGGAIGNGYDRMAHGYVVDFIQWHYQNYYWPTFNVADIAICTGVALIIGGWLFTKSAAKT